MPPYIIFHDSTLMALASRPPKLDELADIPGMGQKKMERYGDAFLSVLNAAAAAPAV